MAGSHPDVRSLATDLVTIKIDEVKDLVAAAIAKPTIGRHRIFIIEDADRMAERTLNVLLKAIEEPAPATVWLLCAPTPQDLLPTIRSRCRSVVLRLPDVDSVAQLLVSEGANMEVAQLAARAAQSHVGRARWLAFTPSAIDRRNSVFEVLAQIRSVPAAVVQAGELISMTKAEAELSNEATFETARLKLMGELGLAADDPIPPKLRGYFRDLEADHKRRASRAQRDVFHRYCTDLLSLYRDVLMLQLGSDAPLVNGGFRGAASLVRILATALNPQQTLDRIAAIAVAEARVEQNVPLLLAVEALFVSLRW
jgi:DNA polymerase-3 subunit delta'